MNDVTHDNNNIYLYTFNNNYCNIFIINLNERCGSGGAAELPLLYVLIYLNEKLIYNYHNNNIFKFNIINNFL